MSLRIVYLLIGSLVFRIPIWYTVKLLFTVWLVLPQFRGAAFIYDRFVRQQIKQYTEGKVQQDHKPPESKGKGKKKSVDFIVPKKVSPNSSFIGR